MQRVLSLRLSTVRRVDCIYVLSKGEVVEKGNYDSLIRAGGAFFQLAAQQGGDAVGWTDQAVGPDQGIASSGALGVREYIGDAALRVPSAAAPEGGEGTRLGLAREEARNAKKADVEKWTQDQVGVQAMAGCQDGACAVLYRSSLILPSDDDSPFHKWGLLFPLLKGKCRPSH